MEWQGIDLSERRAQQWTNAVLRKLLCLIGCIALSCSVAYIINQYNDYLEQKNKQTVAQIDQLTQTLQTVQEQVLKIQHHQFMPSAQNIIDTKKIDDFIVFLQHLSLKGSLEMAQLAVHDGLKLKLVGKLTHQTELESLEKYLQAHQYLYKIDDLKTNETHQIEFGLMITLEK